jgi:hypothetical protein
MEQDNYYKKIVKQNLNEPANHDFRQAILEV